MFKNAARALLFIVYSSQIVFFPTVTHVNAAVKQGNTMMVLETTNVDNAPHPTDRRAGAVSNCTLDLAVQCTAVEADKSFLQGFEKWPPTKWSEDTGRNREFIVSWPVFQFD